MKITEIVSEELTRRGFLGALGAGAATAAGLSPQDAEAKPKAAKPPAGASKPMNLPVTAMASTDTIKKEQLVAQAGYQAGLRGVELAQFLAQCKHESDDFQTMREYGDSKRFTSLYDITRNRSKAVELGNIHPGDGARYHGRGFIQITGRNNYRAAERALGIHGLEAHPKLAELPGNAARIAVWYWKNRVKPYVDNFADTPKVTKLVNGGYRGLQDRKASFKEYIRTMTT